MADYWQMVSEASGGTKTYGPDFSTREILAYLYTHQIAIRAELATIYIQTQSRWYA